MNNAIDSSNKKLDSQLNYLKQEQFTGLIDIKSNTEVQWKIYLCLGRIVWADGGPHAYRSWIRLLKKHCPKIDLSNKFINNSKKCECWKYRILTFLWERNKITQEQLTAIIKNKIVEVMFDLLQEETTESLQYSYRPTSADFLLASGLKISLTLLDIEEIFQKTQRSQQNWSEYCQKTVNCFSPNLAPQIKDKEKLKQEVPTKVYENFVKLIDGKQTLRDLAVILNQEVQRLTCSLIPYIQKELLELITIPDIKQDNTSAVNSSSGSKTSSKSASRYKPLIVCIDDSPQIIKVMETIIRNAGYRFIGIEQALQAIPTLVSSSPDLIFLDIGMPIVNGYEICNQLRRVSKLKNIPVIMLTGQDGIIDRVRAKVAGASDFLSKPIDTSKILNTAEAFLSVTQEN
ncbi:MAG: response regulator [Prochloraceae cyanobacterium]|nr:response regulator [Prochloraceae cyanobacterium]